MGADCGKTCTVCGLAKSSGEFSRDFRNRDGRRSCCKQCCKIQERDRKRSMREKHPGQVREQGRTDQYCHYYRDIERSRAKGRAYHAVRRAVARGDLVKPDHCEACGKLESAVAGGFEAHHYLGYAPEHYLDVRWLCIEDHRESECSTRSQ